MNKKSGQKEVKGGLVNVLLVVLVTLALLYLILQTLLNFFLPTYFKLEENTNILLVEPGVDNNLGKLYFVHFDVQNKKVNLININPQTQVNLLGGYDNYEIRSVYPLLAMEKKDEQFLTAAYSFALNEVVDRVVLMPTGASGKAEGQVDVEKEGIRRTDLEIRRRQDLQKSLAEEIGRRWRVERILDQELLQVYFFLNTGISWRAGKLDNEGWDNFHQQNFSKSDAHDCAVVVINSTGTSGLASRIAAVLEKNGYLVTRTGNYAENMEKTTIYYNDESKQCMELVSRSMKMFPFVPEVVQDRELPLRHRAGVVIIAGEDWL